MKKWRCLVFLIAAIVASCDKESENTSLPQLENSFQYGETQNKVGSVIYTANDADGCYTFYVSPTSGIKDIEVMLLSDDYIKLVTDNVSGKVDLIGGGENSVEYKDIEISKATSAQILKADLEINLTSERTVSIVLESETKSGEILRINYYGLCKNSLANTTSSFDVVLDKSIYSYYFGILEPESNVNNYYFALTDGTFEFTDNTYAMTSPGHVLVLDLYANAGENWREIPTGVFESSEAADDHTYSSQFSGVRHYASASSKGAQYSLSGPVTITEEEDGTYTVTASFLGENNVEQSMVYKGELKLVNGAHSYAMPQYDGDMYVDGKYATAVYNGDLFENGSGAMSIQIWDEKYEADGAGGLSATLMIFGKLFAESTITIEPGQYVAGTTLTKGTWMPCAELSMMGVIIPIGTYGHYDDGSELGYFSYASEGTIDIEKSEDGQYNITFDLKNGFGDKLQGKYTGMIDIYDESDDDTDDDGTSTLEEDYEMDLSHVTEAKLYTPDEIYVQGIGYCSFDMYNPAAPYCLQDIRFSSEMLREFPQEGVEPKEGDRFEGDIMKLQIIGDPADPKRIVPGTYQVVPERWPAYFQPGVCVPGILLGSEGFVGTSWQRLYKTYYKSTDSEGNEVIKTDGGYMNGHACIYGGSITISKPEGVAENVFTIEFNGIDVRKHNVTGTWTGPIAGATYTPGLSYGGNEGEGEGEVTESTTQSAIYNEKGFVKREVMTKLSGEIKALSERGGIISVKAIKEN